MRCDACGGLRRTLARAPEMLVRLGRRDPIDFVICAECDGSGVIACCEGTERHAGVAGSDAPPFGAPATPTFTLDLARSL